MAKRRQLSVCASASDHSRSDISECGDMPVARPHDTRSKPETEGRASQSRPGRWPMAAWSGWLQPLALGAVHDEPPVSLLQGDPPPAAGEASPASDVQARLGWYDLCEPAPHGNRGISWRTLKGGFRRPRIALQHEWSVGRLTSQPGGKAEAEGEEHGTDHRRERLAQASSHCCTALPLSPTALATYRFGTRRYSLCNPTEHKPTAP